MLLHLHRPTPPLDRFVELVTYYAGFQPDHSKERLLPDGAVEIIVDLTEAPKRTFDREHLTPSVAYRDAWISGMRRSWIVIEAAPGSSMVVIRFRPGGAYPFLGFGVEGIADVVEQLDDVVGPAAPSLRDRILEASTTEARMAAVEAWLLERARGRLEASPVIEHLTNRLFTPGGVRIADVVEEVGFSQRHVRSLFRKWVGLPPKQYGRIRRFQQLIGELASRSRVDPITAGHLRGRPIEEPDWTDLALAHGYYDQAHLANEFREFSGLTPRGYVTAYRGLENYLPID